MGETARQRFDFAEYLALEEIAQTKHEYLDGAVWAMAGGSPDHAAVAGNVMTLLNVQLQGRRCRVYTSDLRVRVQATGLGTYPDLSVVCGAVELDPEDRKGHTVVNTTVVVEVLSPSTQDYDRGEKFEHYTRVPTVREVVFVAHDRHAIEVRRREPDGSWSTTTTGEGGTAQLTSIDCTLAIEAVYRDPLA